MPEPIATSPPPLFVGGGRWDPRADAAEMSRVLHLRRRAAVFAALFSGAVVGMVALSPASEPAPTVMWVVAGAMVWCPGYVGYVALIRRQLRRSLATTGPEFRLSFDADGFTVTTTHAAARHEWRAFTSWAVEGGYLVLRRRRGPSLSAVLLRVTAFPRDQHEAIAAFLDHAIGPRRAA